MSGSVKRYVGLFSRGDALRKAKGDNVTNQRKNGFAAAANMLALPLTRRQCRHGARRER
jgi:hypothetical protein